MARHWGWVLVLWAACAPRPQLLVAVDTDLPLAGQLEAGASTAALSPAAAVDTVRVEVLAADLSAVEARELVAPDPADWPLTFGIAAPSGGPDRVLLRVRVFRASLATPVTTDDATTLEPLPEITVERAVELPLPADGVRELELVLSGDCLGVRSSFLSPATTCLDGARLHAPATDGVLAASDRLATRAGSWAPALEVPCQGPAPEGALCIPGGYSVLGSADLASGDNGITLDLVPLRPAAVSPFFLDRTELTVGRYRALVKGGAALGLPIAKGGSGVDFSQYCTWLGADDASDDELPLNCVAWEDAREACQLLGGELPTEAQWEHAARGRGQGRRYPWGDDAGECCVASVERGSSAQSGLCPGAGVEPVASHAPAPGCPLADLSRDGVADLGGSMQELLLDSARHYADPCWQHEGVPRDPACLDEATPQHMQRGADWNASLGVALSALRRQAGTGPNEGFRCAYPDGAP